MITQLAAPPYIHQPGYNPVVYYFKSTNASQYGFKYIVQVKDENDNIMFEKKILPDYDNNKCVCQIDRELSDYLTYDFDLTKINAGAYHATKSYKKYKISVGEEYYYKFKFDRYAEFVRTPDPSWTIFSIPVTSVQTPQFQIGDQVNVFFDADPSFPNLMGTHEVKQVLSDGTTAYVILDVEPSGGGSSITESGWIEPIPNNKTVNLGELIVPLKAVFNGALSNSQWLNYNMNSYEMNNANPATGAHLFLAQITQQIKARRTNSIFLNYMKNATAAGSTVAYIRFTNDAGVVTKLSCASNDLQWLMQVNVGPSRTYWGTPVSLSGPIVTPTTKWYTFTATNATDKPVTKTYRVTLDDSCTVDNVEMLYLDKLGSFLPYNFTLKSVESQRINRDEYTQRLGGYVSGTGFTYESTDGGSNIYNSNYQREFLLRTRFLNDEESISFQNVLHSPVTMIKVDDVFQKCIITTNNIEIKKGKWSELKRYELNVKLANQDKINI